MLPIHAPHVSEKISPPPDFTQFCSPILQIPFPASFGRPTKQGCVFPSSQIQLSSGKPSPSSSRPLPQISGPVVPAAPPLPETPPELAPPGLFPPRLTPPADPPFPATPPFPAVPPPPAAPPRLLTLLVSCSSLLQAIKESTPKNTKVVARVENMISYPPASQ